MMTDDPPRVQRIKSAIEGLPDGSPEQVAEYIANVCGLPAYGMAEQVIEAALARQERRQAVLEKDLRATQINLANTDQVWQRAGAELSHRNDQLSWLWETITKRKNDIAPDVYEQLLAVFRMSKEGANVK